MNFQPRFKLNLALLLILMSSMSFVGTAWADSPPKPSSAPSASPTHPVYQWEQELVAARYTDEQALEDAYRRHLLRVQAYLQSQQVETEYVIDRGHDVYGRARLKIKPLAQKKFSLNHFAHELAQEGVELEYGTKKAFFNSKYFHDGYGHGMIVHSAARRWYFNGKVLSNFADKTYQNILQEKLDNLRQLKLDPQVNEIFSSFLIRYQNYQNLSVNLKHPFPYLAMLLDEKRQIYIPYRTPSKETPKMGNAIPWAFNHYSTMRKLADIARSMLTQYQPGDGKVPATSWTSDDYWMLHDFFYNFEEEFALKMIDLNALLYLLMEHPENIHFMRNPYFAGSMDVFINDRPANGRFAYILNLPWPGEILEQGDTYPLYTSKSFQIFYRYHEYLFHRLLGAKFTAMKMRADDPATVIPLLELLIDIDKTAINFILRQVRDYPWKYQQLQRNMQRTQEKAVKDMQINKNRHDRYRAQQKGLKKRPPSAGGSSWCARQVSP
ncbi:MAG: hypothetical protein J6Y94_03760 [Bacteriovoracaceae bacterium]|nr:hypothetical protein [Bacteriovoracaceae bacterium]